MNALIAGNWQSSKLNQLCPLDHSRLEGELEQQMAKVESSNNTVTKPTLTDEQLLAIRDRTSQEFADLTTNDKMRWFMLDNDRLNAEKNQLERKQKGYGLSARVENGMLIVSIPVNEKPEPSSTGKTLSIASTHGNVKTPLKVNGKEVTIGLNAYIAA